jgi:hypothetical protein
MANQIAYFSRLPKAEKKKSFDPEDVRGLYAIVVYGVSFPSAKIVERKR